MNVLRLGVLLISFFVCSAQAKTLVFAEFDYIQRLGRQESVLIMIIRQALKEQGYDMEVRFEPGRRAIFDALAGKADGLLVQARWLSEEFPSLVRVEQRLGQVPLYLYGLGEEQPFDKAVCNDTVGILNGFDQAIERYSKEIGCSDKLKLVVANYPKQLLNLLQGGRVNWVFAHVFLENQMQQMTVQSLYRQESSVQYIDIYMYLNEKHADLAAPLAQSIRKLLEDDSTPRPFTMK